MTRSVRIIAAAAVVAAVLAPVTVSAATASPAYYVQAWIGGDEQSPDRVLLIASVTVPTSTPLPVKVRIPVPEGVDVTWSGEIVSPEGTDDIAREGTITTGVGGRSYEFTLEQVRDGQIEGLWKPLEARKGGASGAALEWVQTEPAEMVGFTVRTPAGAKAVRITPAPSGAPEENAVGERLYTLSSKPMRPGEKATVDISFKPADDGSAAALAGGRDTNVVIAALGALVLVLAAAIALVVRRERSRASAPPE